MLFRIYTEDKNRKKIESIVSSLFDGFTLFEAQGFWRQQKERTLVIEIVAIRDDARKVYIAAERIKEVNEQEAVLVIEHHDASDRLI